MSKKVIIDVGLAFSMERFSKLFNDSLYNIIYIGEKEHVATVSKGVTSNKVEYISYEDLYSYDQSELTPEDKEKITDVVNYVVNDKLTTELMDRTMSSMFLNYSTKNDVKLIKMTISAYKYVVKQQPEFMLLYECCHNIRSWVVAKVCEFCNIPVRYCREHIFTWRNVLLEGMCKHPRLLGDDVINDKFSEWEYNMFLDVESKYSIGGDAIKAEYMEVLKSKKSKKIYSLKREILEHWKTPSKVVYKHLCYKAMEKVCTTDIPKHYIVFFLHLQPERTTLPEGYGFTQQYKALSLLNELVPEGWKIVVKEHPATIYKYCNPTGRWPEFYKAIASLRNVVMVPLETDTYKLLGNSTCAATITGTTARESLMMGKPVITFGIDAYFGNKPVGIYNYEDDRSLMAFLSSIKELNPNEIKDSFRKYIHDFFMVTGTLGVNSNETWSNKPSAMAERNNVSRYKLLYYALTGTNNG